MIRVLFMIAAAGFVLSVGTLSAAIAIGGPEAVTRGGWHMFSGGWGEWDNHTHGRWDSDDGGPGDWGPDAGPQATRTLAWTGGDSLDLGLAADVRYVQADGPGTVTVTGPQRAVDRVVVRGDSIRYGRGGGHWRPKLSIVVRAPAINRFDVAGYNALAIEGYRQKTLRLDVAGMAKVTASGEVEDLELDISGKGDVDLGALKTRGVDVDISGAAEATIAPTEWARLDISGAGDVRLLTNPRSLETDISGAGKVRQGEAAPTPSPPSPPQAPSPKSDKL
jgi:hypothetical protein